MWTSKPLEPEFLDHLCRSTGLPRSVAARVVADVMACFGETLNDFVQRRHGELQAGPAMRNEAIFARIAEEIAHRRFRMPTPSTRQIRRIIYG